MSGAKKEQTLNDLMLFVTHQSIAEFNASKLRSFSDIDINFQNRIADEVNKGFDTRDEMNEVFREIADEFDVSPDHVWRTYYSEEWK